MRRLGFAPAPQRRATIAVAVAAAALAALAFVTAIAVTAAPAATPPLTSVAGTRPVLFVGNNWGGTADVIQQTRNGLRRIGTYDIVPDKDERMTEIATNPDRLAYFLAIRQEIGEGHDQLVDDMFSVGRLLIVSRPSFGDVVALDLKTREIVWRFVVDGYRADHMAISPDRKQVAVSASTGNVVHILDTRTGQETDRFDSGDSPHENNYSAHYPRLYHASIGRVYTPTDDPALDTSKGDTRFQIVDTRDYHVIETIHMGDKLAEAGYPNMSDAVRPMALSPGERFLYFQVSFFHGFAEYNFLKDKITRVARMPDESGVSREDYLLDSAHHGLAMNPEGNALCAAGTMDDYVAIVSRRNFRDRKIIRGVGDKPYWVTNSGNGRYCFISWSRSDKVSAISYAKRKVVDSVTVGVPGQIDHPQRMRMGSLRLSWLG